MKSLWNFFLFFNAQITIAFMLKYNPQKTIKIRPRKSSLELAFCVLINSKQFSPGHIFVWVEVFVFESSAAMDDIAELPRPLSSK
jgi:hypothetical protein